MDEKENRSSLCFYDCVGFCDATGAPVENATESHEHQYRRLDTIADEPFPILDFFFVVDG